MTVKLTKFMHSRYAMMAAVALMALVAWATEASEQLVRIVADRGTALPSANSWIASADGNLVAGLAANVLMIGALISLNRTYNLLRSLSMLFAVLFAFMQTATPELTVQFSTGSLLMLTIAVCTWLMFGCYGRPYLRRRVFLVFFLLSAGAATQYAFAVYIPVMLLMCVQMRVFSGRTLVAALLGVATPWWLLLGFGVVTPDSVHLPQLESVFSAARVADGVQLGVTALTGAAVFVAAVVLDFFRTMAYNARSRSYNGAVVLLGFATIVAMVADYNNMLCYLGVLNACASLQAAQFFIIHRTERSWIGIAGVLAVYAALAVWNSVA